MHIIREDIDSRHGQFVATIDGIAGKAVLGYTRQGPDVISADHVIVPEQMGGKGVGTALVKHMVQAAEEKGMMIVPICPFVQVQYKRHPEWERHFTSAPDEKPTL